MGYTNIPTDGSGRILITDIGASKGKQALICHTDTPSNPSGSDYYLHPSMQTTLEGDRIQSDDQRRWQRNRDLPNGIMKLGRNIGATSWTEGVFTCQFFGTNDSPISVGVYSPRELYCIILYIKKYWCSLKLAVLFQTGLCKILMLAEFKFGGSYAALLIAL